uniref:Uncharacterized protein n=1 Tax=Arundo donax TaxID=35708 RepID=A0A0A8Y1A8_ARUDO
MSTASGWCFWS